MTKSSKFGDISPCPSGYAKGATADNDNQHYCVGDYGSRCAMLATATLSTLPAGGAWGPSTSSIPACYSQTDWGAGGDQTCGTDYESITDSSISCQRAADGGYGDWQASSSYLGGYLLTIEVTHNQALRGCWVVDSVEVKYTPLFTKPLGQVPPAPVQVCKLKKAGKPSSEPSSQPSSQPSREPTTPVTLPSQ